MAFFGKCLVNSQVRNEVNVNTFLNCCCFRDQWKSHVPSYHPVFMDGWSPDYPVIDELDMHVENKQYRELHSDPHYSSDYNDYESSNQENIFMFDNRNNESHHEGREQRIEPVPSERDISANLRDLSARSDISVDSIERNGGEDRGFNRNQDSWLEDLQARAASIVQVTYPRTANNDKELTVVRGEFLEVCAVFLFTSGRFDYVWF